MENPDMRSLKTLLMCSIAVAVTDAACGKAEAQSYAFGVGSTSVQVLYRKLMDCMYTQAQGSPGKPGPMAKAANCIGFNTSGYGGMILYAPTGSGNGKLVLRTNDKNQITKISPPFDRTLSRIAYTNSAWRHPPVILETADYDGVQFVGTDDVVNMNDVLNWNTGGTASPQSKFGNLIQVPIAVEAIAIGYNTYTVNLSDTLKLSRNAICGIVSGHVTQWDNPILTAANGGVVGTGNIIFVHRWDEDGETFLLSNALIAQCRYEFGPNNETDPTIVSYAFPWTDRTQSCSTPPVARGSSQVNWPDQFPIDQCGNVVKNPGGGHFASSPPVVGERYADFHTSGSGALISFVKNTRGAIGYASQGISGRDSGIPGVSFGGAQLQSQWDLENNTGKFHSPTIDGARAAMSSAVPQMDNTTRANPLTWSLQGVVPNPVVAGAYPISGFSWILMYQCYRNHNTYAGPRAEGIPVDNNAFF